MTRERLWLRFVGVALVVLGIAAACSGAGFSGGGDQGATGGDSSEGGAAGAGATSGTAGTGAVSGSGGGGTTLCNDASECDDEDPCTADACNDVGVCEHPPKCTGDQAACCGGVCGECCGDTDCDDQVECTADTCFAGLCSHAPSACPNPATQYCSATGCKDREGCPNGTAAECDDGNPCTSDRCESQLCTHDVCAAGTHCCEGVGCGECCFNAQCNSQSTDVCKPAVCDEGECHEDDLCTGSNQVCCERTNGTADCGTQCCTAGDCQDDGIDCTITKCTATGCKNEPHSERCPLAGQTCLEGVGCTGGGGCQTANDCDAPSDPCQRVECNSNRQCVYVSACTGSTECCAGIGCRQCCSNTQCQAKDIATPLCCPDGSCGACCQASDCAAHLPPRVATTGTGIDCVTYQCTQDHQCLSSTTPCLGLQTCCPGRGCVLPGMCVQTDSF